MGKCKWQPPKPWDARKYKGCPHPSHGDSDYCIFHIPLEKKREKPELKVEFERAFNSFFNYTFLKDDAGAFAGFIFPDNINLSRRDFRRSYEREYPEAEVLGDHKSVDFHWATFGDRANFAFSKIGNQAAFAWAKFGDQANFDNTEFSDWAFFYRATFGGSTNFRWAKFGDSADFNGATLGDSANFWETSFGDSACFIKATFGDSANFWSATFGDSANFWLATFGDSANFVEAKFIGSVDFSGVKASETAFTFSDARLEKSGDLSGSLKKPSSSRHMFFRETEFLGPALFHETDLSRVRFELVDLQNLSFFKSRISQTEFVSCQWGSGPESRKHWHRSGGFNLGFRRPRLLLDELIWRKQNQKPPRKITRLLKPFAWLWSLHIAASSRVPKTEAIDKIEPIDDLQAEDIEMLGLQLKQSLEVTKDPITAGDFHFCVMEMKLEKARRDKRRMRAFGLALYKFINGYGERYARTAMWLALLVAVSTLLFAWQGESLFKECTSFSQRLEPAFYWACQHILPFKFGKELWTLSATDTAMRWLTMIETFIGSTLFAFMLLAMRRRFKR